ncbi:MAG: hypothetical protein AABX86_03160 [Nanoarchaeota archaeon]
MRKEVAKVLSILFFGLSIFFFLASEVSLTGAFLGIPLSASGGLGMSIYLLIIGLMILPSENKDEDLETKLKSWTRYKIKKESHLMDMEQEYLKDTQNTHRTSLQECIERLITGEKLVQEGRHNKQRTYEEQFYEGHAAQGGRIIDVASHLETYGKHEGDLFHFNKVANARYLWIVDEDGNFIVGNRQVMQHDLPSMNQEKIDLAHRRHKLPHATLARGKRVLGSGEVIVEGGKIKSFNAASGHYVDLRNLEQFNKQGEEVFRYFARKVGWNEVKGGAKYTGYSE